MPKLQAPPSSDIFQWMVKNPDQAAAYLLQVYASQNLKVSINGKEFPFEFSSQNGLVNIQYKMSAAVADSTATAADVSSKLNQLLALLRARGDLPQ